MRYYSPASGVLANNSEFSKLYAFNPIVPNLSFQSDMFVTIISTFADLNAFIASPYDAFMMEEDGRVSFKYLTKNIIKEKGNAG